MAFSLNLTLLVQMVHFIGAYQFITRYFLKPGYKAIKEDDERAHQIRTSILYQQNASAERSLYKDEQWRACQEQFMLNRPVLDTILPPKASSEPSKQFVMPSENEIIKTVDEVSAVLKERVLHV